MPTASGSSDATNSSLFPTFVLNAASTHVQAAEAGSLPSGPKPSCASSDGGGPARFVTPSIQTWPYTSAVRETAEIMCVSVGGHCRFAQPISRCGSAVTSFDGQLGLPAASRARTT